MRFHVRCLFAAVLFASALVGCAADLTCPGGKEPAGEGCRCPTGQTEVSGRCVRDAEPVGGETRSTARNDAGRGDREDPGERAPEAGEATVDAPDAGGPPSAPDAHVPVEPPPEDAGACNGAGECLTEGPCGDGKRNLNEECDDGNPLANDDCYECKRTSCGDHIVQPNSARKEECDVGAGSENGRWSAETCSPRCQRTVYTVCRSGADCTGAPCIAGVCAPMVCPANQPCTLAKECPRLPEHRSYAVWMFCLPTSSDFSSSCPEGLVRVSTEDELLCVGPAFAHVKTELEILETQTPLNPQDLDF